MYRRLYLLKKKILEVKNRTHNQPCPGQGDVRKEGAPLPQGRAEVSAIFALSSLKGLLEGLAQYDRAAIKSDVDEGYVRQVIEEAKRRLEDLLIPDVGHGADPAYPVPGQGGKGGHILDTSLETLSQAVTLVCTMRVAPLTKLPDCLPKLAELISKLLSAS